MPQPLRSFVLVLPALAGAAYLGGQPPLAFRRRTSSPVAVVDRFTPLPDPSAYEELIAGLGDDAVSVIKFQAPWCRTCHMAKPKLNYAAKQYPRARFYSVTLDRKRSDSDQMYELYQRLNVTEMPYIEVFCGATRVDTLVVPPSRVAFLHKAIRAAQRRLGGTRRRRERRRVLLALRQVQTRRRRLAAERKRLSRRNHLLRLLRRGEEFPALPQQRVLAERRRHLISMRSKARQLRELRREEARLRRRRQLIQLFVLPPRGPVKPAEGAAPRGGERAVALSVAA